jgi:hypothetical protein
LFTLAVAVSVCEPAVHAQLASASTNAPAGGATQAAPAVAAGPSDPILNLLVEKGMITEDEAVKTQAQADALRTNMAAQYAEENSKWKISKNIKDMELFGDLRLRYEDRDATDPGGLPNPHPGKHGEKKLPPGNIDLNRLRYALRVGVRGDVFDDFYFGFRLETSSNPRSSWVTMGTSTSGTPYSGPFGKSQSGIDVGQLYLGWQAGNWLDVTVGKMPNPLFTSSMVWSPSINPEGAAEHLKYGVGPVDFFANAGQFLYSDSNPTKATSGYFNSLTDNSGSLPFLLTAQGGADIHFTKQIDLKAGGGLYWYNLLNQGKSVGQGVNGYDTTPGFADTYVGQGTLAGVNGTSAYYNYPPPGSTAGFDGYASNESGINDLLILEIPFTFTVKLKPVDIQAFGDYAKNLEGGARALAAYNASHSSYFTDTGLAGYSIVPISSPQFKDDNAYQFGLAVASKDGLGLVNGTVSKKHGWEARVFWQHVEQYSLDPNLLDLDFFSGAENLEGIYTALGYGFNDNFSAAVRYGFATRINDKLGTGGSGTDIPQMNPINRFQLIQVDLIYRF